MTRSPIWLGRLRDWTLLSIGCVGLLVAPVAGELDADLLAESHAVSRAQWLDLHLRLLGLELTYPAYRIHLALDEKQEQIVFDFWISSPLARHLDESGRSERGRVLSYHAAGIRDQLQQMLTQHFPVVAEKFAVETDLVGTFYAPAQDVQAPPVPWAKWQTDKLIWSKEP